VSPASQEQDETHDVFAPAFIAALRAKMYRRDAIHLRRPASHQLLVLAVLSRAARRPLASLIASSLAQK
jgi:hypothetical protein